MVSQFSCYNPYHLTNYTFIHQSEPPFGMSDALKSIVKGKKNKVEIHFKINLSHLQHKNYEFLTCSE